MKRILASLVVAFVFGILFAPRAAQAQEKGKAYRVGYLNSTNPTINAPWLNAFRQGLRELGWIEGQNISIDYRWADGKDERLAGLASELVKLRVDIIVTSGNAGVRAAREASDAIPIIAATFTDPIGTGLAATLARPGGNITGLATQFEALVTKQQQFLKEMLPNAARVAILVPPAAGFSAYARTTPPAAVSAAQALGVEARVIEVQDEAAIDGTLAAAKREGVDAIHVLPGPFFVRHRTKLVESALKHRLPAVYELKVFVDAGGLIAYGPNFASMYHRAAGYVDRILKGAKPGELPIEQPTKFELVINLKTARALGLKIPQSLLLRADQVIE